MADLHRPRFTVTEAGPSGTPWAYGDQVLYDAHERRAADRAREAEVRALVAAARAKAAEAAGPDLAECGTPGR